MKMLLSQKEYEKLIKQEDPGDEKEISVFSCSDEIVDIQAENLNIDELALKINELQELRDKIDGKIKELNEKFQKALYEVN